MSKQLTLGLVALLTVGHFAIAGSADTNNVGLYYASTNQSSETVTNVDGTLFKLGPKAEFKASEVILSSLSNANDQFNVSLNTGGQAKDVRSLVLRVGGRGYQVRGWSSDNSIQFDVPSQTDALAIAKSFAVECPLRAPPGYKYFAQFVPVKAEFRSNEPVMVKFVLKNRDTRPIVFQQGGRQRGPRDNQYGFRAMFQYTKPVPDVGDPTNFGGLCGLVRLEPGEEFSAEVDLRKWFAFDKPGNYSIHGFYALEFYPPDKSDGFMSRTILWSEYASADFVVALK